MKKLPYLLIFGFLLGLQSCVQDEEDIFNKPAAERLSEALQAYQKILTAPENGWVMEYYPKGDCSYGGYTVLLSFTEEDVTVASEISSRSAKSLYSLKEDMGPVLSFDTYNEIFHFFSDPAIPGLPGLGYEGDYEFIFMGQENNELILKGKKTGNTFRMHPLSKNQSWEQTLNDLKSIIRTITPPDYYGYGLTVENTEIFLTQTGRALTTEPNGRNFEIDYIEGKDTLTINAPFIYTTSGIKLYQPIQIGGKTLQYFDWSEIERTLVCSDNDVNARITFDPMPLNKKFCYTKEEWYFHTGIMSSPFREKWKEAGELVQSGQGLRIYQAYLSYNAELEAQILNVVLTDGYNLYECLLLIYCRPVKWTDDQLEIEFTGKVDDNGNAFYNSGGEAILQMLNGKYTVTCDNPSKPAVIMFKSTDKQDVWFQLSLEKVYNL